MTVKLIKTLVFDLTKTEALDLIKTLNKKFPALSQDSKAFVTLLSHELVRKEYVLKIDNSEIEYFKQHFAIFNHSVAKRILKTLKNT